MDLVSASDVVAVSDSERANTKEGALTCSSDIVAVSDRFFVMDLVSASDVVAVSDRFSVNKMI